MNEQERESTLNVTSHRHHTTYFLVAPDSPALLVDTQFSASVPSSQTFSDVRAHVPATARPMGCTHNGLSLGR